MLLACGTALLHRLIGDRGLDLTELADPSERRSCDRRQS